MLRVVRTACVLLGSGLPLVILATAHAVEGTEITTVSSRVSNGYVRSRLQNGSFEPETYAFGEGGLQSGPMSDNTIDRLHFIDVARTIAGPLRAQNYLPANDPGRIKLLVMVYWGTTAGAGGASSSIAYQNLSTAGRNLSIANAAMKAASGADRMSAAAVQNAAQSEFDSALAVAAVGNSQRDRVNRQNAVILGYDSEFLLTPGLEFTAFRSRRRDLIDELEDDRYFVVLMAYDFQMVWKEKKHKLLWEARFSIRQRHNDFEKQLAAMAENASRYFGQDSHGLVRKPVPEGSVTLGDVKVLGVESEKK